MARCSHTEIVLSPSPYASVVDFKGPTLRQRATALGLKRKLDDEPNISCYPSPLVLPGDDLANDPKYPPQSVLSWVREKHRNKVTEERRTIYVAAPPRISKEVAGRMKNWAPIQTSQGESTKKTDITSPSTKDVVEYLSGFFHGMPVAVLPPSDLEFIAWDAEKPRKKPRKASSSTESAPIGLRYEEAATRIRTRYLPSDPLIQQLNLDDLLDAAIDMLPEDAYALLLLIEHDLYESEEDEFVCGMAAGGSRVAVVSMARYNPMLDEEMEVEREHAWPASHCTKFVKECCEGVEEENFIKKARTQTKTKGEQKLELAPHDSEGNSRPLAAAIKASSSLPLITSKSPKPQLVNLWLSRVCRTASHELCHCFGIDHCVYFACNMNASASIKEDPRQAPYLCPVDVEKVLRATGASKEERDEQLISFCEKRGDIGMFAALGVWLKEMQQEDD